MIHTKAIKWGNSIGIRIPKKIADEMEIKPDQKITIEILKAENPLKELFGALPKLNDSKKILKEIRGRQSKHI